MWTDRETEQNRAIADHKQRNLQTHRRAEEQVDEENAIEKLADGPTYVSAACENYPY